MFNSIRKWINALGIQYAQQPQVGEGTQIDFVNELPQEISLKIFSYLNSKELDRCLRVNKTWKVLASDKALWNALLSKIVIGQKQWAAYFGDIGQEPSLPKDIHKILNKPCPFWPGKTIEETHMLVLIPETINGKSLTLATFSELVKTPKGDGHTTRYHLLLHASMNKYKHQATPKSHWVLMTKDVIKESTDKNYTHQKVFIDQLAKKTKMNYEVPNVLDAVICIYMYYVHHGERLFNTDNTLWTYTRCQEKFEDNQVTVGGFSSDGFMAGSVSFEGDCIGVAALQKFY